MAGADAPTVTIASFRLCSCTAFKGPETHLIASKCQMELAAAKAVAISYTWGEFDRRDHSLGHWTGDADRLLDFQLGAEWDISSFIHRLVQLTTTHLGVWIDQACLRQDVSDEEWAGVLMAVPLVYKSLPVIALLPGRLCRCLPTVWEQYKAAVNGPQRDTASGFEGASKVVVVAYENLRDIITGSECFYSNGWCSWIDRIWPSQELRYSRQISVCWTEEGFAACRGPGDPDFKPELLTGQPMLLWGLRQSQRATHREIIKEIRERSAEWHRGLWLAVNGNLMDDFQTPLSSAFAFNQRRNEEMARFLLGDTMKFGTDPAGLSYLPRFVRVAEFLAESSRRATKAHDYIFSVWADWPSYQAPRSFTHMTCFELLGDALDQFKSDDFQLFVPSTSPAGLVDSSSVSWKFSCDLSKDHLQIKDTRDVYRPLFWLNVTYAHGSHVPLRIKRDAAPRSEPQLVKDWILDYPYATVFEHVLQFKNVVIEHFIADVARASGNHSIYGQDSVLGKRQLDIDDIYDLVCLCLNLDSGKCRKANLQVMCIHREVTIPELNSHYERQTETSNRTCFGLANWEAIEYCRSGARRTMSVGAMMEKWPLYEVVSLPEQSDVFRIAGVWVPISKHNEYDLECVMDSEGCNGVLV